ncbi:mechanosensitive ion channel family protein [Cellulomonas telluris]|uniref:mechanosensitive ion channel family protein n=1 Tax=Cellulomonas telluris TaxID=2306636 RepID=UPI001FE97CD3|nr:mechanosensitive ion channel domain-containing protein [Cellulomonas telluris]
MSPALLALAGATPSPTETTDPLIPPIPENRTDPLAWLHSFWDWFTGLPMRIVIIVVVGALVLALLRRLIGSVTNHIASGDSLLERGVLKPLGGSEVRSVLQKASPVAAARRTQRARTIGSVLRSTASVVVGSITAILVLDALGVNVAPLLTSAGIVGVAVGFGAQALVKDFLSGLFMLLEDQYGVGDVVDVGPATGTVEAVALRVTKIRDADGTLWYVPNGSMLRVGNKTQGFGTAVVELDVDYFADLDEVRALLERAAAEVAAEPVVGAFVQGSPTVTGAERLSAEAVTVKLSLRTEPGKHWEVGRHLRAAVRRHLTEAGIPLGGQRDLLAAHREELAGASPQAATGGDDDAPTEGDAPAAADPADVQEDRDPHDTPVHDAVHPDPGRGTRA